MTMVRALVLGLCSLVLGLYLAFKVLERSFMIDALPLGVEPAGVVVISDTGGIRESCGVAVFRLSMATRERLMSAGLSALKTARQARASSTAYYRYREWRPTPAQEPVDGAVGIACGELDGALDRQIAAGLRDSGGFFSHKPEALLLVLPKQGLIVFAYEG